MEPLPLMLVGCGLMGQRHLRGYAELARAVPGHLRLVAVCDPDRVRATSAAQEAAELLGSRPQVFDDLDEAIRAGGAVAADVVTPNRTHRDVAITLLQAGLHVQCEKPIAVTVARGQAMVEAARAAGRVLAVAENDRRDPINRLLRHIVSAGLLGPLNYVSQVSVTRGGNVIGTPWRHHLGMGGVILDVCIHLAYILESLAGPLEAVQAISRLVQPERLWHAPDGHAEWVACETDDVLAATLTFANGAVGHWAAHFASSGWGRFERVLIGADATLECPPSRSGQPVRLQRGGDVLEGEALLAELPEFELPPVEAALFGSRPARYSLPSPETDRKLIAAETADFISAVRDGRAPEVPAELGLRSVAVIYALLESCHAARPVRVAEVERGAVHGYQDMVEKAG